jgi:thioredoxin-dependent peroxiredoxin
MSTHLKEGDAAPAFELESDNAGTFRLDDLRGKYVVLYFYPKDDTPGCTVEACSFRDSNSEIEAEGAVVLGVSTDSLRSHDKFRRKHRLSFPLLSDPEHRVAEAYGVYGLKKFMGREYMGVQRATFVIGPDGRLAKVWPEVKPADHAEEVLAWLRSQHKS